MNHQLGQVGCALGSIKSHILQLQIMVSSYLVVSSSHSGKLPAVNFYTRRLPQLVGLNLQSLYTKHNTW